MLYYCFRNIRGDFAGAGTKEVEAGFSQMLGNAPVMGLWTFILIAAGFGICWFGIQNGIEKVSKVMMSVLFLIMIVLAVRSVFLEGAGEGVRFYLIPDFQKMQEIGIGNVIFGAMSQAFFTLSIGIGAMMIFGSYLGKERSLTGEALSITILDTFVATMAGFIIIPTCFAYGIEPGSGPSLIFLTIPNIFAQMPGGQCDQLLPRFPADLAENEALPVPRIRGAPARLHQRVLQLGRDLLCKIGPHTAPLAQRAQHLIFGPHPLTPHGPRS